MHLVCTEHGYCEETADCGFCVERAAKRGAAAAALVGRWRAARWIIGGAGAFFMHHTIICSRLFVERTAVAASIPVPGTTAIVCWEVWQGTANAHRPLACVAA